MTRPGLRASGNAAEESELLAQLGLPTSASPEDVDDLHQAVSDYLASAPPHLRAWAHAQAAALDEAYLQLTDPVGLGGSALRSPARPPAVVPGGPATPPVRRGSPPDAGTSPDPETEGLLEAIDGDADGDPDAEDLAALYAMVTPSVHADMLPGPKRPTHRAPVAAAPVAAATRSVRRVAVPASVAAAQAGPNPWKRMFLGTIAVAIVAAAGYGVINVVGASGGGNGAIAQATPRPSAAVPTVDQAKVAELMTKLQANPKDAATLLALANEYYAVELYAEAAAWLDKVLAIEPENVRALLARGAAAFNLGDNALAEKTWRKVVAIDPKNVEAHYDLGFMYFYQASPDYAAVVREWTIVIELDPTSSLAQNAKAHLDALVARSMIPAISPAPSGSPAASADPGASPAQSPAVGPSAEPTAAPSASPAASTVP